VYEQIFPDAKFKFVEEVWDEHGVKIEAEAEKSLGECILEKWSRLL
jgi:hypothetical protein